MGRFYLWYLHRFPARICKGVHGDVMYIVIDVRRTDDGRVLKQLKPDSP